MILFFSACCLGFAWSLIFAHHQLTTTLPKQFEEKLIIARGKIISIPETYLNTVRFDFLIQSFLSNAPIQYPIPVRIKGYFYKNLNIATRFKKGDIWQLPLRLRHPRGFWNPGSFDYQAELFKQDICATGYILEKFPSYLIQHANSYYFIDNLRKKINDNIKKRYNLLLYQGL